ncbi:homeobox protein 2-like [Contarinia nasturtii]|uniref:homeobox protein 2-like n=1 Tax=Contarinia nasturtii TaxID=265458 RepID=UPI0012D3A384|nr:homeobox protein 2-like [Contarinia nasturtii]
MGNTYIIAIYILFLKTNSVFKTSALPQLDIPSNGLNYNKSLRAINDPRVFLTNGHSGKAAGDTIIDSDPSNEIGSDDTLRYDRDRSHRFGPPYTEDNDQRYYSYSNDNSRYNNRNLNGKNEDVDDDDKYYSQPRSPYYISEKQRNRYGYRDYSTFNGNYNYKNDGYNSNDGRNPYVNRNQYENRNPYDDRNSYDDRYINNPTYDDYSDRNRYSNGDYDQNRLDLERRNRIEDANLKRILDDVDKLSSNECSLNVAAQWNFETDVNEATQQESILAQQRYSYYQRELWEKIQTIDKSRIYDDKLYRQVRFMSIIGPNALPPDQFDRVS